MYGIKYELTVKKAECQELMLLNQKGSQEKTLRVPDQGDPKSSPIPEGRSAPDFDHNDAEAEPENNLHPVKS